jgi:hypothetical protein
VGYAPAGEVKVQRTSSAPPAVTEGASLEEPKSPAVVLRTPGKRIWTLLQKVDDLGFMLA